MQIAVRSIVLIVVLLAVLPAAPAYAAEYVVTRTDDPAPNGCQIDGCSLREAVIAANTSVGPDTIIVGADTFTLTRPDVSGEENASLTGDLDLTSDVIITGVSMADTTIRAGTSFDNGIDNVFQVLDGDVTLSKLDVRFGTGDIDDCGGGIVVTSGSLTLSGVGMTANTAKSGSAICNFATLRVLSSLLTQNSADDAGTIWNSQSALIEDSTFSGNQALYGGGIANSGSLLLRGSTLYNNSAYNGGAIWNRHTLTVINSTISGNRANTDGGGILADMNALTRLYNTTLSGNRADDDLNGLGRGGGVILTAGGTGLLRFSNTLLAGNQESTQRGINGDWVRFDSDCGGAVQSDGYSLIENLLSTRCTAIGAFVAADPLLGTLQNNGGATFTHLPAAGSPAVDAGDPAGCRDDAQALATDQRGIARPQGSRCDIGAVEVEQAAPSPTPAPPAPTPAPSPSPGPATNRILLPMAQR